MGLAQDDSHEAFLLPDATDFMQEYLLLELGQGTTWSVCFNMPMRPLHDDFAVMQRLLDPEAFSLYASCMADHLGTSPAPALHLPCLHAPACAPCCILQASAQLLLKSGEHVHLPFCLTWCIASPRRERWHIRLLPLHQRWPYQQSSWLTICH